MTITLYQNTSEKITFSKSLTTLATLDGTLRDESSIINPTILMSDIDSYIGSLNYAYIAEFNRYYFVTGIDSVRNGLWRISMHVDVLSSFSSEILANTAIIQRNANEYNLLLNDGLFKTQQNPRISQYAFPSGFTTLNFVLAIAGN